MGYKLYHLPIGYLDFIFILCDVIVVFFDVGLSYRPGGQGCNALALVPEAAGGRFASLGLLQE